MYMSYIPDFQCFDVGNYDINFNICVCVLLLQNNIRFLSDLTRKQVAV